MHYAENTRLVNCKQNTTYKKYLKSFCKKMCSIFDIQVIRGKKKNKNINMCTIFTTH